MSVPDPRQKKILTPEEQAMRPQSIRFSKDTGSKDERTQRLDSFLRTLGPEKADKPSNTTSQKNNGLGSDTLNGRRKAEDNIGVSYGGLDSLQREIKNKLQIDQQNKGFDAVSDMLDTDNRLNQINKKLTDDYMRDRGVDPKEFRDAGKKLHKYLKDDLDEKPVSSIDFEIAYKKFNRLAHKLGDIDKRIGGRYFEA